MPDRRHYLPAPRDRSPRGLWDRWRRSNRAFDQRAAATANAPRTNIGADGVAENRTETDRVPTRQSADTRLALLRDELALATEFHQKWEALTAFTLETFAGNPISREEIDRFDEMRAELNRLFPRVVGRVGNPTAIRQQFGQTQQLSIFGFLLEAVPHLGSFVDDIVGQGQNYRERFFETGATARATLQRALGRIERDIAEAETGPLVIDSLADQAATAGLPAFLSHLADAESHFESGAFDDGIHSARRAIERLATEIANVVAATPRRRRFRNAMDALRDAGLIDDATHRSIVAPQVGFWGWASEIGTHDEDDPGGDFEVGSAESRLAIERARAIAEYMLSRLARHLAEESDERSDAS